MDRVARAESKWPLYALGGVSLFGFIVAIIRIGTVYGPEFDDLDWEKSEAELEKAYTCGLQCSNAGYQDGSDEFHECVAICMEGH